MATIPSSLQQVHQRIDDACRAAGRPASSVRLMCVSKTRTSDEIRAAFDAGERCFGENHVQEGLDKITALHDLRGSIEWHLIGPLQSNKTRVVAESFDWVDSIDRLKVAERLSLQRPAHLPALQVCIQVNISGEPSKSGVAPGNVAALAQAVALLPRLSLRGLMAIPAPASDIESQRAPHRAMRELMHELAGPGHGLGPAFDTLSIGMSDDLDAAIIEGSTLVRIGTAIFGERTLRSAAAPAGAD